jgi:hypothetical protein
VVIISFQFGGDRSDAAKFAFNEGGGLDPAQARPGASRHN